MKHGYLKKKEAKEQAQKSGIVWREFDHQPTIKVSLSHVALLKKNVKIEK